jgi:ATP-dependent Clp protease adapter protein ClpS
VIDVDDMEAARAEWRSRQPAPLILPPDTSLLSVPGFVPAGFVQGLEILNDNTTTMKFVREALTRHAGLESEDAKNTTLAVHTRGGALIPLPSLQEARRIAALITAEAAQQEYPLRCRAVSVGM